MFNLSRRNAFLIGLVGTFLLFVVANFYSFQESTMADGFDKLGFPFDLWMAGGYAGMRFMLWRGLAADILIALNTGVSVGLLFSKLLGRTRELP